jgi:hypothetical protein
VSNPAHELSAIFVERYCVHLPEMSFKSGITTFFVDLEVQRYCFICNSKNETAGDFSNYRLRYG